MAPAALLTFVFVFGFFLGYVVREIISQRRQCRALMQLPQYEVHDFATCPTNKLILAAPCT
jgi:hypothetical protein